MGRGTRYVRPVNPAAHTEERNYQWMTTWVPTEAQL
jgi:hypothetical protein